MTSDHLTVANTHTHKPQTPQNTTTKQTILRVI